MKSFTEDADFDLLQYYLSGPKKVYQ